MIWETARFKKAEPGEIYRKGQYVWLDKRAFTVTITRKHRKSFGKVAKRSKWPDLWVTVDIWNKEEFCAWDNWDRGIKQESLSKAPKIRRLARPSWKAPKI